MQRFNIGSAPVITAVLVLVAVGAQSFRPLPSEANATFIPTDRPSWPPKASDLFWWNGTNSALSGTTLSAGEEAVLFDVPDDAWLVILSWQWGANGSGFDGLFIEEPGGTRHEFSISGPPPAKAFGVPCPPSSRILTRGTDDPAKIDLAAIDAIEVWGYLDRR